MPFEIQDYLSSLRVRKSKHTIRAYTSDLAQFSSWCKGNNVDMLNATRHDINVFLSIFLTELTEEKRTLARKRSCLSSFYKYLELEGKTSNNPVLKVEGFRVTRRKPDFLTKDEIWHLRQLCSTDVLSLFEFLLATGARESEVSALNWNQVNFEKVEVLLFGKGEKERFVPFSRRVYGLLGNMTRTSQAVFTNKYGQRLNPGMIYYRIRKLRKFLGRNLYPHLLRHTFATHLVDGGATIADVQSLLGHESLATTSIYTHPTEALKERYQSIMDNL